MKNQNIKKWDIFISYASEDKIEVAQPIAAYLDRLGFRVWFDDFVLEVGDSITDKIHEGLSCSRFGLVIISPNFIKKKWPTNELKSFLSIESFDNKFILPLLHNIGHSEIKSIYPILSDRVALDTKIGLKSVTREIAQVVGAKRPPGESGSLEGIWIGESGRLSIENDESLIAGNYDWYGERWVGSISGTLEDGILLCDWDWQLDNRHGRGIFVEMKIVDFDDLQSQEKGSFYMPRSRAMYTSRLLNGAWWFSTDSVNETELLHCINDLRDNHNKSLDECMMNYSIHRWSFSIAWRKSYPFY